MQYLKGDAIMRRTVEYFEKPGRHNTEKCIDIVENLVAEEDYRDVSDRFHLRRHGSYCCRETQRERRKFGGCGTQHRFCESEPERVLTGGTQKDPETRRAYLPGDDT
jgi:hypothetical protein